MTRRRCITEMGMGVDVHGKDATKAAKRAVSDAIRHSSLSFSALIGKTAHDMFVDVTIGVPNPEERRHRGGREGIALRQGDRDGGEGRAGSPGRAGRGFHPDRECGRGRQPGRRRRSRVRSCVVISSRHCERALADPRAIYRAARADPWIAVACALTVSIARSARRKTDCCRHDTTGKTPAALLKNRKLSSPSPQKYLSFRKIGSYDLTKPSRLARGA